jgi:hypothetical protein
MHKILPKFPKIVIKNEQMNKFRVKFPFTCFQPPKKRKVTKVAKKPLNGSKIHSCLTGHPITLRVATLAILLA